MQEFVRLLCVAGLFAGPTAAIDLAAEVEHRFADNGGTKIHYVTMGQGPLVVMIHGFPDFWYSWRHQMEGLADRYQVIAVDQRGYNKSDQPTGVENYAMRHLVADVAAVIRHAGREKATIVGHDWGGAVAWQFALNVPQMTENLIILNLPHPNGMARELATNQEQVRNSDYARNFQEKTADDPTVFFGMPMKSQIMAGWVTDAAARERYVEAFDRSDFDAMLNFYKANYPRLDDGQVPPELPQVQMSVLQFHGLQDTALHANGLNHTWDWLEQDLTLVTIPKADHFVQQDAAELVTSTMRWWLDMRH